MIKAQRGTKDIMGNDALKFRFIEDCARKILGQANFEEIKTPIFEATELFARGIGDSTDIVNKEMYTFCVGADKDTSITLRPENTAGVVRAFVEHNLTRQSPPQKFWYFGPMFRYERPQAGRQRQFHQVGIEIFGSSEASADVSAILIAQNYLKALGLKNLEVEINSLGCPKCRVMYRENLKTILGKYLDKLCPDCAIRYEKNPLRMLDCKNEACKKIFAQDDVQKVALADFVCVDCAEHFKKVCGYLDTLEINYRVNKLLVRGLDYYNGTVFEIKSKNLGSQDAVCGGGRYDALVETLGGDVTPAVGWAMGVERLASLISDPKNTKIDYYVVSQDTASALELVQKLWEKGFSADFDFGARKFTKQLEKAAKTAKNAMILGEDEIKGNFLTVKNLDTGEQTTKKFEEL